MKLFGRELKFASPKKVDVVIFDEVNSHLVVRAINKSYSYCVFNQRPEDIWVGFNVFRKFFGNLSDFQWEAASKHQRGFMVGTIKQLRLLYFKSCLDVINPKAVVTFIDNSSAFGWLSKHCREYPFIAIQNGSRLSYAASDDSGYHVQHFFSYGHHEKILFPKLGYHVENFYPAGSLVASLYSDQQRKCFGDKYDLLIVSGWRGNIGFQIDVEDTMRSMRIMDCLLSRYIAENSLKAAVILRSERDSKDWVMPEIGMSEERYYKNIYRDTVDIVETDFSKRNIFPMMQKSKVIISCLSSALIEAYGMKKKILFCNFTGTDRYHCDFAPAIVTTQPAWDELSKRLGGLLTQKDDDYQKEHKKMMSYYMAFPDGVLTHEYIAIKIDEIIKKNSVIAS